MVDDIWLCLFKADFSDKASIKGNLRIKIRIKDIEEVSCKTRNLEFKFTVGQ